MLILPLFAAMSCEMMEELLQSDPTVFEATLAKTQINASQTEVTVSVICDVKWSAKLTDSSWGSIAQTLMSDNNTGIIILDLGFNQGKDKRSNTLNVTAGSKTVSVSIEQEGVGSLFQPATLQLRGTAASLLSFLPGTDWKVTTETDWIVLPDKTIGLADTEAKLSIKAKDEFKDVGTREGALTFTFDGQYKVSVPVTQYQTDAIILEKSQLEADYKAQTLALRVDTNTDYTVTSDAAWVHPHEPVSTKALNVTEVSIDIDANPASKARTAVVTFTGGEDGKTTAELSIVQEGYDPILDVTTCGLYGFAGADYTIQPNIMQSSLLFNVDGSYSYRIIVFQSMTICEVSGLPLTQDDESSCTLRLTISRSGSTLIDRSSECVLLGHSDNLRWYKVVDGGEYLIIPNTIIK